MKINDMPEMNRIEFVTRNFNLLQGLRLVPFGLAILIEVMAYDWWPWYVRWRPLSGLLFFGIAVLLSLLIGVYYGRLFGRVQPLPATPRPPGTLLLIGSIGSMVIAGSLDSHFQTPISLLGLAIAGFILVALYVLAESRQRPHYVGLAAVIALMSLLPLTGLITTGRLFGPDASYGTLVIAFGIIGVGIIDHLLFVRQLHELPRS